MTEFTKFHRANLTKLADYLDALPEGYGKFSMSRFVSAGGYGVRIGEAGRINECGTSACAVGHGPQAGIAIKPVDLSWHNYSDRAFGVNVFGGDGKYMFGPDNLDDPHAAAARIREVLAR